VYRGITLPANIVDIGAYELGFFISTLADESDGDFSDGDLSLREAIAIAAANTYPDSRLAFGRDANWRNNALPTLRGFGRPASRAAPTPSA
jgi:hypothetical protein